MAKAMKSNSKKKGPAPPSVHSRAARRAESPSLNTDKSLKTVTPPSSKPRAPVFNNDSGIKKKKAKALKRQQKVRQQKLMERADIVNEQLVAKVQKSIGRFKTVKGRSKDWEDLNKKLAPKPDATPVEVAHYEALDALVEKAIAPPEVVLRLDDLAGLSLQTDTVEPHVAKAAEEDEEEEL
ncbi:hypothetical protein EJ06DRAFT_583300 [Trichodelitschia bisporula]|uniref:Ribosome biogenesis protein Alb1 n=1 Tax=Trichodelitschia bisporula TaxID=703511 RepID=A0A6G1HRJ7_9PEZI|nr:hypothetical protein EJ06DRAFT_583300 [Trichodelitschia bisporula]